MTNYLIYWDEGTLPGLTSIVNVTGITHIFTSGILINSTYNFQVAAENMYGIGPISSVYTKIARTLIDKLSPVTITQDASPNIQNINFDWIAPASDNGSPVTAYKLSIMNGITGTYLNNETLCNGTNALVMSNTLCTVSMSNLITFY